MRRSTLIALLLASLASGAAAQQDVYVSTLGSDSSGNGSMAAPFRTVTRALSVALNPGDQIIIAAGSYRPSDGELFPLLIGDGVSLIGPAVGTATIDGTGVFTPIVVVGSNALTTRVESLRLHGAGNVFEVFGNPADLIIRDCTIQDGMRGINHDFVGSAASLTVERCTFLNLQAYGIFWSANAGSPGTHRITIRDCALLGKSAATSGIELDGAGDVTFAIEITGNRIEKYTTGLNLAMLLNSSEGAVHGLVEGNSITGSNASGLSCTLAASGAQASTILMDALFRGNSLSKNDDHGGVFNFSATGAAAQVIFSSPFQGNTIRKNKKSGLYFRATPTNGGSCTTVPDLGGGTSGSTGGNTFELNDDSYSLGAEFDLRVESADPISARNNWWTVLTDDEVRLLNLADLEAQFERHVFHFTDSPSSGLVDYSGYYLGDLHFDPSPRSVVADGQHAVTLTARAGSAFSAGDGVTPTALTVEKTPVLSFEVGPDGRTLTFLMPDYHLIGGGGAKVQVEHPAGHAGNATVGVEGTASGRLSCFIATAAFGDPMAEELQYLRLWRDRCLAQSACGRWFIRTYYACSPPVARFIARSDARRAAVRVLLRPVIWAARLQLRLTGESRELFPPGLRPEGS